MSGKAENTEKDKLTIVKTGDGTDTVYSSRFDEHYHSQAGSLSESIYVYLEQGLDYYRKLFPDRGEITVFEVGFGIGLNALVTFIYSMENAVKINYYAVEKFPVDTGLADQFDLGRYELYKPFFIKLHKAPWNERSFLSSNFSLTKIKGDWTSLALEKCVKTPIDVVYYDAFSYDTQPEMWTTGLLEKLWQKMTPGGVLTTYAAKGQIKRNLTEAGFYIERLKGALSKRHMLRAIKPLKGQNIVRYISISNIKFDNIPINPQTLDLAIKIHNGDIDPDSLPPIRVMRLPTGQFLIRDGRHRVTAFKLNGLKQIKAYIFIPKNKSEQNN